MDRWCNKIAVVTGASSGIGAAIAKDLVQAGLIVVGLARRKDRMDDIQNALAVNLKSRFHPIKCDVSKEDEVKNAFNWIEKTLGGTDILINNAGILTEGNLCDINNAVHIQEVLNTNIMALVYCTREAFNSMKSRNIDGHIILMNSALGHNVLNFRLMGTPSSNIYSPSKYAVTALTETYRQEFANAGTKIKITSLSPGLVDTDIIPNYLRESKQPLLQPEDISNAVLYVLGTPPHVQVHELCIKPIGEQF